LPVLFSSTGQPLNLGRDERLFTRAQRLAISIRDGGCMEPGCDRPPSWTEIHHIRHWKRDHGNTNVADGILLCRRGHLRVHNEGWEITRDQHDQYWLIPPPQIDPTQTPRLMKPNTRTQITHPVTLPDELEPAATATG
ncbi:HNH endonuclease signature motif containing protein, partial [Leifsonia flava]